MQVAPTLILLVQIISQHEGAATSRHGQLTGTALGPSWRRVYLFCFEHLALHGGSLPFGSADFGKEDIGSGNDQGRWRKICPIFAHLARFLMP